MDADGIRAAARAIRGFLPELVGRDADDVDERIAELLSADRGDERSARHLAECLNTRDETSAFLQAVLDDPPNYRPPQVRHVTLREGGYEGLAGSIGDISAPRYRCPVGDDYTWWRMSLADAVPVCRKHQARLVPE